MLYISEKAISNQSSKNKNNINQNIDFLIKDKDFIIYSEKSIQLLGEYNGITTKIGEINPNRLFSLEKNEAPADTGATFQKSLSVNILIRISSNLLTIFFNTR